jgi:hypothetical protein
VSNERLAIHGDPTAGPFSVIKGVHILRLANQPPLHPDLCVEEATQLATYLRRHLPAGTALKRLVGDQGQG